MCQRDAPIFKMKRIQSLHSHAHTLSSVELPHSNHHDHVDGGARGPGVDGGDLRRVKPFEPNVASRESLVCKGDMGRTRPNQPPETLVVCEV